MHVFIAYKALQI